MAQRPPAMRRLPGGGLVLAAAACPMRRCPMMPWCPVPPGGRSGGRPYTIVAIEPAAAARCYDRVYSAGCRPVLAPIAI
jgi:hypothetical protein